MFRRAEIARVLTVSLAHPLHALTAFAHAIVDDDVWLEIADEAVKILSILFRPPFLPFAVKPKHCRIVSRDEFTQLRFHVFYILFLAAGSHLRGPVAGRRILARRVDVLRRVMPVDN